ncbi:MAG: hypothetical protein JWQ97_3949, partial [Phenylobacterium sp.]|nr:hypothetical protein [Phenylobacterium sp.]
MNGFTADVCAHTGKPAVRQRT